MSTSAKYARRLGTFNLVFLVISFLVMGRSANATVAHAVGPVFLVTSFAQLVGNLAAIADSETKDKGARVRGALLALLFGFIGFVMSLHLEGIH